VSLRRRERSLASLVFWLVLGCLSAEDQLPPDRGTISLLISSRRESVSTSELRGCDWRWQGEAHDPEESVGI
jgi:hypothetical protein